MFRNPDARYAILLLGLSVLLWLPRFRGPIDLRYDAAVYYILGTSLAEGKGYRLLYEPGDPEAIQYPPLLPALVAVHQLALGTSDFMIVGWWLRLTFFGISTCYVLSVLVLARRYLASGYAFLVGLITALYLHNLFLSDLLFAEIPFALCSVWFVILNGRSDRPGYFLLTALFGTAAYLLRSAGLALVAAWVAERLVTRRWKQAMLCAAVALLPIAAWQMHISHVTSRDAYLSPAYAYQRADYQYYNVTYVENIRLIDPFRPELGRADARDMAARVADNLVALPRCLGEGVAGAKGYWKWLWIAAEDKLGIPMPPDWVVTLPSTVLGCVVLASFGLMVWRRQWFIPLYIAGSAGLICLTPWPGQLTRYLSPLTPFLALALVQLLACFRTYSSTAWTGVRRHTGTVVLFLVLSVVFGIEAFGVLDAYVLNPRKHGETGSRWFFYDKTWRDYDAALAWLAKNAGPDEVSVTSAAPYAYLKTGRKAVMPPMVVDVDEAQHLLDSVPARYVIVDELKYVDVVRRYTVPVIRSHPQHWQQVFTVPGSDTHIFRRRSP